MGAGFTSLLGRVLAGPETSGDEVVAVGPVEGAARRLVGSALVGVLLPVLSLALFVFPAQTIFG